MTTMQRVDAMLARFDRKSPRAAYAQICEEMNIHWQKSIAALLSDAPRDWGKHRVFECDKFVLGPKGCMSMVPLVLCSRSLRRISLRGCQVTDEFVTALAETLQDHESIRCVDISDNPLVTVYSADPVIKLLRYNKNIVRFSMEGTHIGTNVASIINNLCDKNHKEVLNYYADDYFRMKDIFNYLDVDGTGWVQLRTIVLNVPYPQLQEQLIEKIALKRPRKRSDGTISVNTFLELVYFNYKTDVEIAKRGKETDTEYSNIIINWKRLLEVMDGAGAGGAQQEALQEKKPNVLHADDGDDDDSVAHEDDAEALPENIRVLPPADLHRLRIRYRPLELAEARKIIAMAIRLQMDTDSRSLEEGHVQKETPPAPKEAVAEGETEAAEGETEAAEGETEAAEGETEAAEGEAAGGKEEASTAESGAKQGQVVKLSLACLRSAYHSIVRPPPLPNRYRFLEDHDEDYIPPMMRAGSRLLSISKLSFLDSPHGSAGDGASVSDDMGGGLDDDDTRQRWWALPPAILRLVLKFFNKTVAKLPKKRQSTLAISPRTQRDNAMESSTIPVSTFLSAEFTTGLEKVFPRLLADKFLQYSIPIDVSTITLQEIVNCLNEYYNQISVDRVITLEQIRAMSPPAESESQSAPRLSVAPTTTETTSVVFSEM